MGSQESMFQPPESSPQDVRDVPHSTNRDPREQARQQGFGPESSYEEGYGPVPDMRGMEGEKIQPLPQRSHNRRRRRPWLWFVVIIAIIFLFVGLANSVIVRSGSTTNRATAVGATQSFNVSSTPDLILRTNASDVHIHGGGRGSSIITVAETKQMGNFSDDNPNVDGDVAYRQDGDTVSVTTRVDDGAVNLDITVPDNTNLQLDGSDGDINVSGVSGQMVLHTDSGDINIDGTNLTSSSVISSSDGDIAMHGINLAGSSSVTTDDGDIAFSGSLDPQGNYKFAAQSGDVVINLPQDAPANINAHSNTGDVNKYFDHHAFSNSHQASVDVDSNSGDVTVYN